MLLLNQKIIADGTPQDVMTPENLHLAYGIEQQLRHPATAEIFFC
jgi:manganese/iron transport system ATP-binding protein